MSINLLFTKTYSENFSNKVEGKTMIHPLVQYF